MPKVDEATREGRKERVFLCLRRNTFGLTEAELADEIGLERRTLNNYLRDLEMEGKVYKNGTLWLALPYDQAELRRFSLSPEEGMTLYLATRLFVKQHDKRNEPAETALLKLAAALTTQAGVGQEIHQAAQELSQRPDDGEYNRVFRTVMQGYIYRRVLHLTYEPARGKPFETDFAPYLLEPSAIGFTTYAIGYSSLVNARRTYKLERIRTAQLTQQEYDIPADFPGLEVLRHAWSIFYGEELTTVTLRFSPTVRKRVEETRWHPSEEKRSDPDQPGYLRWTAQVADTTDMLPWIRGWGGAVEVLGPEELRKVLIKEVQSMARVYGVGNEPPMPIYQLLWAKLSRDKTCSHPLICHLLDVAAVTQVLWRDALTAGQRTAWSAAFGLDEEAVGRLLTFWAALHDLGKASPAFQRQWREAEALFGVTLPFPKRFTNEFCPHGLITSLTLPEILTTASDPPQRAVKKVARALGGHHGAWPTPKTELNVKGDERGGAEWDAIRRELVQILRETLQPPALPAWPFARTADTHAFLTWFSGLVSVADWIGSMETYFPYVEAPVDPAKYYTQQLTAHAPVAFQALHWPVWQPPTEARTFNEMFPFPPSAMQQAVIDLAARLDQPALVLIEAPTGSGKTEAALYLADTWARVLQQRGLYVAMPTMATSNQMWERVGEYRKQRHDGDIEPLLVHSQARWVAPPPDPTLQEEGQESEAAAAAALAWFLPRKKSLLAPCAVGTVDQALLSVLQARHFFVRLFGLSDKTVIFDEIHAYDTYISTIFQRLLGWLHAMRVSVVLLSATLPAQTRRELLTAYAGQPVTLPEVEYPAITWATADGHSDGIPLPKPEDRPLTLDWLTREPEAIVTVLREALREGGCAAVICNTVARAQEVYGALKTAGLVPETDLTLFHARFPFGWRDELEKGVLARFGKTATRENGARPERAIVVATQVIEQSLDLDFDMLVSDLAPVDLLVQRAGRLHRHPGRTRPAPVTAPRLCLAVDADGDAAPDWGNDRYIYAPYLLLRTYLTLRGRAALTLPGEVATLIETVYGDELPDASPALLAALIDAQQAMQKQKMRDSEAAEQRLVYDFDDERLLYNTAAHLEEDEPEIHADFQALTRLGRPSIALVCLYRTVSGLNTEPDASGATVELKYKPNESMTEALARATLQVNRYDVVQYFQTHPETRPIVWRKHALLRDHYVAEFDAQGLCPLGENLTLRLTREMGLAVVKL